MLRHIQEEKEYLIHETLRKRKVHERRIRQAELRRQQELEYERQRKIEFLLRDIQDGVKNLQNSFVEQYKLWEQFGHVLVAAHEQQSVPIVEVPRVTPVLEETTISEELNFENLNEVVVNVCNVVEIASVEIELNAPTFLVGTIAPLGQVDDGVETTKSAGLIEQLTEIQATHIHYDPFFEIIKAPSTPLGSHSYIVPSREVIHMFLNSQSQYVADTILMHHSATKHAVDENIFLRLIFDPGVLLMIFWLCASFIGDEACFYDVLLIRGRILSNREGMM